MISDFQRNGWVRDENLRLPEGTTFTPVPIADAAAGQSHGVVRAAAALAVFGSGARHRRGEHRQSRAGGGEQRAGAPRARRTHVSKRRRSPCSPARPRPSRFQPFTLARAFTRGTVRIGDDGWPRTTRSTSSSLRRSGCACSSSSHRARPARRACTCRRRWRSARRRPFR